MLSAYSSKGMISNCVISTKIGNNIIFATMKKREFPNTYVIIFGILLICAVATWFVPGGEYFQQGESLVYREVESSPQTWQIFEALYSGFSKQA